MTRPRIKRLIIHFIYQRPTLTTFADDTVVLSVHSFPVTSLQDYLDILPEWLKDWRIKAFESKSVHVTFNT